MHSLGGIQVGGSKPVRVMGVINASPESFMSGSVRTTVESIAEAAALMEREGADFVDVGGMSTAPHRRDVIPLHEEVRRLASAVEAVVGACSLPVSVDTPRAAAAEAALGAGATILNDVSGMKYDTAMERVVRKYEPSLILCAHSPAPRRDYSVSGIRRLLRSSIATAVRAGADPGNIAVDPAIGFFRRSGHSLFTRIDSDWVRRDVGALQSLGEMGMGYPLAVSVSNKSFIGRLVGAEDPADRLPGSLAFEAMSVLKGADIIRTHNVAPTREAVREVEKVLRTGAGRRRRG